MNDGMPDHEALEKYCRELPKTLIAKLPNNTERREAERLVDVLGDLVHDARERKADR